MRLDRKLLLIIPSFVLVLVIAGIFYATTRLQVLVAASDNWQTRSDYVTTLERGERAIQPLQAAQIVRVALEAERRSSAAVVAARQLLLLLAWIGAACCAILMLGVRSAPRQYPLKK
jgi:hypothetical protein